MIFVCVNRMRVWLESDQLVQKGEAKCAVVRRRNNRVYRVERPRRRRSLPNQRQFVRGAKSQISSRSR